MKRFKSILVALIAVLGVSSVLPVAQAKENSDGAKKAGNECW
jgi:hypothetical protein